MNLRTGLKTMAVALPMMAMPIKSTAQNTVKELAQNTSQVVVHTLKGTKVLNGAEADAYMKNLEKRVAKAESQKTVYKPEVVKLKAKFGAGYGLTPFMNQGKAEPKLMGELGITNGQLDAAVAVDAGKNAQSYSAKIGGIFNTKSPNLGMEAGTVFRYNKFGKDVNGVILEKDVNSLSSGQCGVYNYKNTAFWGAYANPSYKFGKASVKADLEGGLVGFAGIKTEGVVPRADIEKAIADGRMVDKSTFTVGANVGVGADYEVAKNLKLGADVKYSTFDNHAGFNVKATYELK